MKKMFNDNIPLVYEVFYEKIESRVPNESMKEDIIQIGLITLWRCCQRYDPNRGTKFSTYAYNSIQKNMMCMLVRELKKTSQLISFSEPVQSDCTITYADVVASNEDLSRRTEVIDIVHEVYEQMSPKEQRVIKMKIEEYTQTEIAEILSMSKSNVGKIIKKFRKRLKNTLLSDE